MDNGIKQLVDLQNLRVLELTGCCHLTSAGVESLRTKAKQLEVLIWSDDTPEKAAKMGLAQLFSKKGSLFKVNRGVEGKGGIASARLKSSKNFFKRKKKSHKRTLSETEDSLGIGTFAPGYADEANEEETLVSPRGRSANKKREKKKEKSAKDRKSKSKKDEITEILTSPRS